jgi:hypothetical protein
MTVLKTDSMDVEPSIKYLVLSFLVKWHGLGWERVNHPKIITHATKLFKNDPAQHGQK